MRYWSYFTLILFSFSLGFTGHAHAACTGENLIDSMTVQERATFYATVNAQPFPAGNFWHARKGAQDIFIHGTFHLEDPRHADTMARIAPYLEESDLILMEGSAEDLAKLKSDMAQNPSMMFITDGPTLPELLPEALWQQFSEAMGAHGIPAFLASKFRPGYAMMILGMPPCAINLASGKQPEGLDVLIQNYAAAQGLTTSGLEPYDTALNLFTLFEDDDPIEGLRLSLTMSFDAQNTYVTMRDGYFKGEHGAIWQLARETALRAPGADPEQTAKDFAKLEKVMLTDRNHAWLPVILEHSDKKQLFIAVGAAHLTGEAGILNLLTQAGYTLMPLD